MHLGMHLLMHLWNAFSMHLVCILECIYVTVGMGEEEALCAKRQKRIHNTHMSFSDRTKAFGSWLRENNVELSLKVGISDWRSHGQGPVQLWLQKI